MDVQLGDFDIVPALEFDNLIHLAQVLQTLEATLPDSDEIGHWELQADGEKKQTAPSLNRKKIKHCGTDLCRNWIVILSEGSY